MTIMLVSGSPRKGNSEWMLNRLAEHLRADGQEVDIILLRRASIKPCCGCLKCEDRRGFCRLSDGMNEILPRLAAAEAMVMASPVYFEMISGLLKNFIDRTCPVWTQIKGKPLAGLLVAEEGIGQAVRNLRQYADVCGLTWAGSVTVLAKNPHDAEHIGGLDSRLKRLARHIMTARLLTSKEDSL